MKCRHATITLSRNDEKPTPAPSNVAMVRSMPSSAPSKQITEKSVVVRDFRVQSATPGKDAQGESMIEVEYEGSLYRGRGISTDTVEAAARAFLNAINRIEIGVGQCSTIRGWVKTPAEWCEGSSYESHDKRQHVERSSLLSAVSSISHAASQAHRRWERTVGSRHGRLVKNVARPG